MNEDIAEIHLNCDCTWSLANLSPAQQLDQLFLRIWPEHTDVVYFDQHLGVTPTWAGWNPSEVLSVLACSPVFHGYSPFSPQPFKPKGHSPSPWPVFCSNRSGVGPPRVPGRVLGCPDPGNSGPRGCPPYCGGEGILLWSSQVAPLKSCTHTLGPQRYGLSAEGSGALFTMLT